VSKALRDVYTRRDRLERMDVHVGDAGHRLADSLSLPTATVKFGDLDVLHPQGAAVLYARIQAAAMNVCSSFDGLGRGAALHRDGCVNKAVVGAVTQVDSPALSAVYNAHEGKELPTRLTSLPNSLTTSTAR
jgi:UrcA family protein